VRRELSNEAGAGSGYRGRRLKRAPGFDFLLDFARLFVAGEAQVIIGLEAGPHLRRRPEVASQPESGVGRDAALLQNDFVDASRRHPQCLRQGILGQAKRFHELLAENFAGVNRRQLFRLHRVFLVIVHNFYAEGIRAFPPEANPPLIVDSDAVLPGPIAFQGFQPISWRGAKVFQAPRLVKEQKLSACHPLDLLRQPAGMLVLEEPFCLRAGKTAYHRPHTITPSVIEVNVPNADVSGLPSPGEPREEERPPMSTSIFPVPDECASIMARPALGLKACLEPARNSASNGPRLAASHAGWNQESTLKAILCGFPDRTAGGGVKDQANQERKQR